jgi:hypothetical protein
MYGTGKLTSKVSVGLARQSGIVLLGVFDRDGLALFVNTRHGDLVLRPELGHLGHPVEIGVVGEMTLEDDSFPDGQVSRVDGDSAVFGGSAGSDVGPVSLLFLHVETGSVGEEDPSADGSGETEPVDDPERGSSVWMMDTNTISWLTTVL